MDKQKAEKEMRKLEEKLSLWQHQYYVLNQPEKSDLEYDRAFDRLLELEAQFPDLKSETSPTSRVGSDLDQEFAEYPHSIPVLSLDKVYSPPELVSWIEKLQAKYKDLSFIGEEKLDGVSIVLYYEKGQLKRALTRGNGQLGNDVSANVRTIKSVPLRISWQEELAVRGEIFLEKEDFRHLLENEDMDYANPRNLASGCLRRIKSSQTAEIPLRFFAYEGFFMQGYRDHWQVLQTLKELGFPVNPRTVFFGPENTELPDNWQVWPLSRLADFLQEAARQRQSLPYEIDGLVFKLNQLDLREELGYTGHHPRWAIAYKFESPQAESTVRDINLQVGRSGRITPLARIEPVLIGGSTVSNVTLHNQDYINLLELSIGDKVAVSKRGDVIPAIEKVVEKNTESEAVYNFDKHCPSCNTALIRKGSHHFCPNPDCPTQLSASIKHFCAQGQLDVRNLGPETIDFLLDNNYIQDAAALFSFDWNKLEQEKGFGPKKIRLIQDSLQRAKKQPFSRVLLSLGIPDVGPRIVKQLLAAGFKSMDSLMDAAQKEDTAVLEEIEGIGPRLAENLISFFKDPRQIKLIEKLREAGFSMQEENTAPADFPQSFNGQTWCITGSFKDFKPRSLAAEEIEKRGGKVSSSVSSKTDYLLFGEEAGSKLQKARSLGVECLDELSFKKLLQDKDRAN